MNNKKLNMLIALALCATLIFSSPVISNAEYKAMFVFGSSLYDNGMSLYSEDKGVGAASWPYGLRHYIDQPDGRYSDGLIIPDFLARLAGLPLPQPFLAPGNKNYTQGINFASARACVPVENCFEAMNWKVQLEYFMEMVQNLKQQIGESDTRRLLFKAVYLFNFGEDDYVNHIQTNTKKLPKFFQQDSYMTQRLGNLTILIETIYNEGGRKFAFQNIGPIGCMPSIKNALGFNGTCAPEPQELAKMHNAALAELTKRFKSTLPGFKCSLFDFYSVLYDRILHGEAFGFKESERACCGSGAFNGENSCQNKERSFSLCCNLKDHLWFDASHLTHKASRQLANEFWYRELDVVGPYNLMRLFASVS